MLFFVIDVFKQKIRLSGEEVGWWKNWLKFVKKF